MSHYIEISISLVMVFLVLSLVVTAINELIAIQLAKRPKMLMKTIMRIIDDENLWEEFCNSGIIFNARVASSAGIGKKEKKTVPADSPSYIAGINFAKALTLCLTKKNPTATLDEVRSAIIALPDSRIRDVLVSTVISARTEIAEFEVVLAEWFDSTQDRLTGAYARYQRLVAMIVGLVLVVALNVDAIRITREVQVNDDLRNSFVAEARALIEAGIATECATIASEQDKENCIAGEVRRQMERVSPAMFGWANDPAVLGLADEWQSSDLGLWLYKALGLFLTVFAVSLGAPFWFDLLSKIVNIRGAGIKPDTEAERNARQ
jgi:hypothetical protein